MSERAFVNWVLLAAIVCFVWLHWWRHVALCVACLGVLAIRDRMRDGDEE